MPHLEEFDCSIERCRRQGGSVRRERCGRDGRFVGVTDLEAAAVRDPLRIRVRPWAVEPDNGAHVPHGGQVVVGQDQQLGRAEQLGFLIEDNLLLVGKVGAPEKKQKGKE